MLALLAWVAGVAAQLPASDDVPRLWPQPMCVLSTDDASAAGSSLVLDPAKFAIHTSDEGEGSAGAHRVGSHDDGCRVPDGAECRQLVVARTALV